MDQLTPPDDKFDWLPALQVMEWVGWRTTHGVEKPFRDWLANMDVGCVKWGQGKWLVDVKALNNALHTIAAKRQEGYDDVDISADFKAP